MERRGRIPCLWGNVGRRSTRDSGLLPKTTADLFMGFFF